MEKTKLGKKDDKTNVMRILEQKKAEYKHFGAPLQEVLSGVEMAEKFGFDKDKVFKTLVTVGKSKNHFVFMIPVAEELDLKKATQAVGEKSIVMLPQRELLALTGYIHGGCSPIGMKKFFKTTIHKSAENFDTIIFSAGRVGYQVELSLDELSKVISFSLGDVVVSDK